MADSRTDYEISLRTIEGDGTGFTLPGPYRSREARLDDEARQREWRQIQEFDDLLRERRRVLNLAWVWLWAGYALLIVLALVLMSHGNTLLP